MDEAQISIEPFLGVWELDPEQSQYELGTPPQRGQYQLVRESNPAPDTGQIAVVMDWTDAAGKDFHMIYYMTPDGTDHAYPDSPAVDAVMTRLVDARTLETVSKKEGQVVATGRRELSADGRSLKVTQAGKTPDGGTFANVALYRKRG